MCFLLATHNLPHIMYTRDTLSLVTTYFYINLYNVNGEQVFSNVIKSNTLSKFHLQLPAGVYLYRIMQNDKAVYSGKLIYQ